MAINRDSTPPPMIGKIGPYTVFMTPPSTPSPKPFQQPVFDSPKKIVVPPPPPVQPPPQQFTKSLQSPNSNDSVVGFFKNAVTKVQNAHSSLDDHLARWFGLNQSKYQWALDDYYESKGLDRQSQHCIMFLSVLRNCPGIATSCPCKNGEGKEKGDAKAKDLSSKIQSV
uniref:Hydroxyproline-rich glycoprotein family protein n=1 Tax=Quercus lobata TaxID=97700 RepID=A0A7N2L1T3_QUELO